MLIETENLIIRDFELQDAEALLEIKNDKQVLEYDPTFIKRDATIEDAKETITEYQKRKEAKDYVSGYKFAITLNSTGAVIGAVTLSELEYLYEMQIGWMMISKYTGKGYASEAGAAVSDYLLEILNLEYMSVVMDVDNPASFRTAQKSGFKLFEKRVPYDYYYRQCNDEDFHAVDNHFSQKQSQIGSCYYYFRKFNKNSKLLHRFYGDTQYNGRFS